MAFKTFKVRDLRSREKFIVDDVYLNGYAKFFGPTVSAVYLSLCRHANREQEAWPSEGKIAEEWGISEATAKRGIKVLKLYNLIGVRQEKFENGKWRNNIYSLLDKSVWLPPEGRARPTAREVMGGHFGRSPASISGGRPRPLEGNTLKETHRRKEFLEKMGKELREKGLIK